MKGRLFLAYAPFNSDSIRSALGKADYSYYFVLQRYLPLLRQLGEVRVLEAPPDDGMVRPLLDQYASLVYFSFTPPDKVAPLSLCPVVPVFAWEYSSLPDEAFTRATDNWVAVLRDCAGAVTHSRFALDLLREQVGREFPAASIPAPLWEDFAPLRERRQARPPRGLAALTLSGTVIDSACYELSNTAVKPLPASSGAGLLCASWDGEPLCVPLRKRDGEGDPRAGDLTLVGFNDPEPWGVWTQSGFPWVMLPQAVHGEIELDIEVSGYGDNVGNTLFVELGASRAAILLEEELRTHRLRMHVPSPTNFLTFEGVGAPSVGMSDPRDIGIGLARLEIRRPADSAGDTDLALDFRDDSDVETPVAHGFHAPEAQGRWTAQDWCMLELPRSVRGRLRLHFELFHSLQEPGRPLRIAVGGVDTELEVAAEGGALCCELEQVPATNFLVLDNVSMSPSGNPDDPRQLGLGLVRLVITELEEEGGTGAIAAPKSPAATGGHRDDLLYTAVLNPNDGRKNWEDIITGFVYAFRDDPRATLLVKITNHDIHRFYEDIFTFFKELHPFACRLVFLHGFLDGEQYRDLIANTHFVVNASRGEGQCLPLMEFMSSGVPAIAPRNTAMLDYLSPDSGFVVHSSRELTFWPHDPRQVFRTCWHRIDWQSLRDAFVASAHCWRKRRRKYRALCRAAIASQQNYCSLELAGRRMRAFLASLDIGGAD